jgi:hypothetical protein
MTAVSVSASATFAYGPLVRRFERGVILPREL